MDRTRATGLRFPLMPLVELSDQELRDAAQAARAAARRPASEGDGAADRHRRAVPRAATGPGTGQHVFTLRQSTRSPCTQRFETIVASSRRCCGITRGVDGEPALIFALAVRNGTRAHRRIEASHDAEMLHCTREHLLVWVWPDENLSYRRYGSTRTSECKFDVRHDQTDT